MVERTIITQDAVRLWVSDTGAAADGVRLPVLFLHGFSGSSSATGHMAGAVAELGRRFVAPDLRGHGRSEKPAGRGSYSLERFVSDVEAVALQLELDRFHLAGHCMGGMVAAAYAIAHPERVVSLSLIGTSLRPGSERPLFTRAAEIGQRPVWALARRVFPSDGAGPPHVDYSRFRRMGDMYWRRMAADWRAFGAATGEAITATIHSIDLLDAAAEIAAPTLVAHGARDTIFPPSAARRTHESIPGSRLVLLPRDNHVTLVLDPASTLFHAFNEFAEAVEASAP